MQEFINDILSSIKIDYQSWIDMIPKLIAGIIVVVIVLIIGFYLRKLSQARLKKQLADPILERFILRVMKLIFVVVAIILFLRVAGFGGTAAGLLGTAGVGAFVLGFAFKDIGEHFLAGILLAFDKPFRIGDLVELDGEKGKVVLLNLRTTQIKTFDGRDIYIPNGNVIKSPVVNYTIDGFLRNEFTIGLDYDSDYERAIAIISDAIGDVPGVLGGDKKPNIFINDLGTSTLDLSVQYWIDTFDTKIPSTAIKTKVIKTALEALNDSEFYLPGDILELKGYKAV